MTKMPDVVLTEDEVKTVEKLYRNRKTSWTIRVRCKVLLALNKGFSYSECTRRTGASRPTVAAVKRLMAEGGVEAVTHLKPNMAANNARRKVDGSVEALIISFACQNPPEGHNHWTAQLLSMEIFAKTLRSIHPEAIRRVLRRQGLHPEKIRYWCLTPYLDSEEKRAAFVKNMEDILEVYARPFDPEIVVVCLDEKPQQLLGHKRKPLPMKENRPQTQDYEYVRDGTASIFLANQPLTGWVHVDASKHHKAVDWAEFVRNIVDVQFPKAKKIILVMDNLNTHTVKSLRKAFSEEEAQRIEQKIEIHYTPKHGSWLDMAEIGLNILTRQCLKDRRIGSLEMLRSELAAWEKHHNEKHQPIAWHFTTADARIKLASLYPPSLLAELTRKESHPTSVTSEAS